MPVLIERRELIAALDNAVVWPLTVRASQTSKIYRVVPSDLLVEQPTNTTLPKMIQKHRITAFQQGP